MDGIVIQARFGSTRFPGKILKTLVDDTSVLAFLLRRIRNLNREGLKIIVATPRASANEPIWRICDAENVDYVTGSETNLIERYVAVADRFKLQNIVRVTSDSPLIDPQTIADTLGLLVESECDYVSTHVTKRQLPLGMGCESFTSGTLRRLEALADTDFHKEHVTTIIKQSLSRFAVKELQSTLNFSDFRFTLDEPKDLDFLRAVVAEYPGEIYKSSVADIVNFCRSRNDLIQINRFVQQKT